MQMFNTIAAILFVAVAIYYVWLQLFHRERKHTHSLCHFFVVLSRSSSIHSRFEQAGDGNLYPTHCTPQKCLHVDVFNWVWARDRNMGAWIHYPAGQRWYGKAHA